MSKKREGSPHLSQREKIAFQERIYNFHLGLPRPSLWVRHRKVYSERREADVVMTSVKPPCGPTVGTSLRLMTGSGVVIRFFLFRDPQSIASSEKCEPIAVILAKCACS